MKRIVAIAVCVLATTGCSFDLFHDTSWLTACELDPNTPGCPNADADAGDDAGGDGDVGAGEVDADSGD